jgi:hypothetical protein
MGRQWVAKPMIFLSAAAIVIGVFRAFSFAMMAAFSDATTAWREGQPGFEDWPHIVIHQLAFISVTMAGGLGLIRYGRRRASR